MKYSNIIGAGAAVALIATCFLPWVYITSIQTAITGLDTGHTNYGKPGFIHIFFSVLSIILFLTPKVWAKRANIIVGSLNFAWAIRNFLVITLCQMGECPEKEFGIYAVLIFSFLILIMTMLPKMEVQD